MNNNPIGIFDSGLGGLSVWQEIDKLLPNESVIYYADSANCPYGLKSKERVIELSKKVVDFFLEKKCKIVVVACNTATSMAIDYLREHYSIPFVGIEPAVKPAALNSKTGVIGILATTGTLNSKMFNQTKERFADNTEIITVQADDLVEIVEKQLQGTQKSHDALVKHINPLIQKNIDHLVLGCTHFPLLINDIKEITGNSIVLDNPAPAVARRTKELLQENDLCAQSDHKREIHFYSSGDINILERMVQTIF